MSKLVIACQNLSKLVKTWQILSKLVKTLQNMPKPVRIYLNPSELVTTRQNLSEFQFLVLLFVAKIVLTYCEKKMFQRSRKTFEIRGWRPRICNIFEITRTIYSNIGRSEQFLVTEYFFNFFLEVSHIKWIRTTY